MSLNDTQVKSAFSLYKKYALHAYEERSTKASEELLAENVNDQQNICSILNNASKNDFDNYEYGGILMLLQELMHRAEDL